MSSPASGRCCGRFPTTRSTRALRRLGYSQDDATAHGFRATASTLLNESGKWNADAIERQLAHVESDDVRRAYLRLVGALVPRELVMQREEAPDIDYADLSDEEAVKLIDAKKRRTFIESALKAV